MSENSKPKRRWVPVLLVASLALNLLVAGVVFGTAMRFKGEDEARKPPGFGRRCSGLCQNRNARH